MLHPCNPGHLSLGPAGNFQAIIKSLPGHAGKRGNHSLLPLGKLHYRRDIISIRIQKKSRDASSRLHILRERRKAASKTRPSINSLHYSCKELKPCNRFSINGNPASNQIDGCIRISYFPTSDLVHGHQEISLSRKSKADLQAKFDMSKLTDINTRLNIDNGKA